jgi:mgtE-like transporter
MVAAVPGAISLADFIVVSMAGGVLASIGLLVLTVALAAASVRFEWDLDNVSAPLVTASGDMLTLPSLYLATHLTGIRVVTPLLATVAVGVTVAALLAALRTRLTIVSALVRETIPIHAAAGIIGTVAGLTIQQRFESFHQSPALLVVVPPFLAISGAIGGILASRLSTKLHLGMVPPSTLPTRLARRDMALMLSLAVPMLVIVGMSAHAVAGFASLAGPAAVGMAALTLSAGLATYAFAAMVVYYGSIVVYRLGLDPDNTGIPLVTSSVDLGGSIALVLAIVALGLA